MSLLKKAICLNSKSAPLPNLVLLVLLSVSLTLFSSFTHLFVRPVLAASLTSLSDTMTRQEASVDSSHTIRFTTSSGVQQDETIIITFNSSFEDLDTAGIDFADVDLIEDPDGIPSVKTLAAAATGLTWKVGVSGDVMTLTAGDTVTDHITPGAVVEVVIGDEAGGDDFTNPALAATFVDVVFSGSFGDTGTIYVPILDDDFVTINTDIETYIQFDIDIDDIGELLAGSGHNTDDDSSYSIDLGNLIFTDVTDEDSYTTTIGESNDGDHSNDGVDEIYFDLSTNSTSGAVIDVYAAAAELTSASTGGSIPSATEVLAANDADGGWGLACDEQEGATSGTLDVNTPFDVHGTPDSVGAVPAGVWDNIFDTNVGAIQDGDGTCAVRAVAGATTLSADDYTNTLYFRATATF